METHENSVSTTKNLRVETKIVSFVILCTIIITACFSQNNVNAQLKVLNDDLFGNSTQQSTSKESQPFLGINMRGYYTSMPQSRRFQITFSKQLL